MAKLDDILITDQLNHRPAKKLDYAKLNRALVNLTLEMAKDPDHVLGSAAQAAAYLTEAQSAGISVLEGSDEDAVFRWQATYGFLSQHQGKTMPHEPSPCSTALARNRTIAMAKPHLHYHVLADLEPPISEVLVVPFRGEATEPAGTLWVISHEERRQFDSTDVYVVSQLAQFASSAYTELMRLGYLRQPARL